MPRDLRSSLLTAFQRPSQEKMASATSLPRSGMELSRHYLPSTSDRFCTELGWQPWKTPYTRFALNSSQSSQRRVHRIHPLSLSKSQSASGENLGRVYRSSGKLEFSLVAKK